MKKLSPSSQSSLPSTLLSDETPELDDESFDPEEVSIKDFLFDEKARNAIDTYNQGFVEGIEHYLDDLEDLDTDSAVDEMIDALGWVEDER